MERTALGTGADFFDEASRLSRELTGALDRVGEVVAASEGRSVLLGTSRDQPRPS